MADISSQGILFGRPDADTSQTLMGIYGGDDKQTTSFSAVLAVGSDGTIQVKANTTARLILDVQGYYTSNDDGTAPGGFVAMNGKRIRSRQERDPLHPDRREGGRSGDGVRHHRRGPDPDLARHERGR
ncbi:hypothetical protein [Curtobacterium sp. 314Chir4.1]|uniref:hypothetical protein n=1 Tax=Curtobacterium sp. 314Chir4.1 TaxID=1279028 RepID=UPI001141771E|nr:hypothetical protein [Curtobacterium sp. 314Chir4.1]